MHHDFVLVNNKIVNSKKKFDKMSSDYFHGDTDLEFVKIGDNFILYIFDTLKWFKSKFHNSEESEALAYHGVSILNGENAKKAKNVLEAWINLLSTGPETIELTGAYTFSYESEIDNGEYEKFYINKNEMVEDLKKLCGFLEKSFVEEFSVVHFGI